MIVKRTWMAGPASREWQRSGWYLLGILPLYIRDDHGRPRPWVG